MMRTLLNPWFLLCFLLWLLVQTARRLGHPLPFYLNDYLGDAVAVPVIAQLGLAFMRVFVFKSPNYVLSPWQVVFIVGYLVLLFEVVLPYFSARYTADVYDVLLYLAGGLFFCKVMNKPLSHR